MAGRPRKSCVWNYFEYEKETDKCVYQVKVIKDEKEEICGKELSGIYSSNIKNTSRYITRKHTRSLNRRKVKE